MKIKNKCNTYPDRIETIKAEILDSLKELVIYQDTNQRILWANKSAVDLGGNSMENLLGKKCYNILSGMKNYPCPGCIVNKILKQGKPEVTESKCSNGTIWLIKFYPIKNHQNKLVGLVEVFEDITERKKIEEEKEKLNRELKERIFELERFQKLTIGRELKMIELKKKIEELEKMR